MFGIFFNSLHLVSQAIWTGGSIKHSNFQVNQSPYGVKIINEVVKIRKKHYVIIGGVLQPRYLPSVAKYRGAKCAGNLFWQKILLPVFVPLIMHNLTRAAFSPMAFTSCQDRGLKLLPPDGRASTLTTQPIRLAL